MSKFKPCPFCGCHVPPAVQANGIGDNWLECTDCGASTRLREDGAGSEKDWNRRPTSSDQEPVDAQRLQRWKPKGAGGHTTMLSDNMGKYVKYADVLAMVAAAPKGDGND